MLPSYHQNQAFEQRSPTNIKHFFIKSSDIISQNVRITVEDEKGPLWYKTKELMEHEIVDSVMDCKTNQIRWTIHQPKRGWYIRLRSPMFPPGACIALKPPNSILNQRQQQIQGQGEEGGTGVAREAVLTFGCQTIIPSPSTYFSPGLTGGGGGGGDGAAGPEEHSYPPSSRASTSSQASTPSISSTPLPRQQQQQTDLNDGDLGRGRGATIPIRESDVLERMRTIKPKHTSVSRLPPPKWHVTHYSLQLGSPTRGPLAGMHHHPHLVNEPSHAPQTSFFHRVLAPLKNLSHSLASHHFTVQPLVAPVVPVMGTSESSSTVPLNDPTQQSLDPSTSPPQPNASSTVSTANTAVGTTGVTRPGASTVIGAAEAPAPIIAFTDSTPVLRATPSGTLSIDVDAIQRLGVDLSFWVSVCLAYWDFLQNREAYLAASED
ncbi:hypothetical protein FRC19_009516 [Serendipita sp. 401]|nr:hypothetical protein FRC19_009516 [Serendipita sp. 401]KAG8825509.1 hypothetical protein FRC18_010261 [Serendipita sp. 400]